MAVLTSTAKEGDLSARDDEARDAPALNGEVVHRRLVEVPARNRDALGCGSLECAERADGIRGVDAAFELAAFGQAPGELIDVAHVSSSISSFAVRPRVATHRAPHIGAQAAISLSGPPLELLALLTAHLRRDDDPFSHLLHLGNLESRSEHLTEIGNGVASLGVKSRGNVRRRLAGMTPRDDQQSLERVRADLRKLAAELQVVRGCREA